MGRRVLVTGAGGGLGVAMCERLVAEGHTVVASGSGEALPRTLEHLDDRLTYVGCDLSNPAAAPDLIAGMRSAVGSCEVLVNNAGYHPFGDDGKLWLADTTLQEWDRALSVNLTSSFMLTQAVVPDMEAARWGRLVHITSRAGRTGVPGASVAYAASKGGLAAFSRIVALEVGASGITSNCLAPGGRISTAMSDQQPEAVKNTVLATSPLARAGTPDEVASVLSFLISDGSSFVTGVEIDVNGGSFMV